MSDVHVAKAPYPLLQAELCGDLLTEDVTQAQEALQRWRAASIAGAKLTAALQDGTSNAVLSRAIQVCNRAGWSLSLHDAVMLWACGRTAHHALHMHAAVLLSQTCPLACLWLSSCMISSFTINLVELLLSVPCRNIGNH